MSIWALFGGKFKSLSSRELHFVEHSDYEEGFAAHYESELKPLVEDYEQKRLAALEKSASRLKLSIPIGVVGLIAGGAAAFFISGEFGGFICLGIFGLLAGWIYSSIRSYQSELKFQVFPKIVSYFENAHYNPTCQNKMYSFQDSQIIPDFDKESSEDEITATYKGVQLDVFETTLQERRRNKNRTYYVTIFKGVCIHLSLNKKFNGITVVKRDRGSLMNWLASKFSNLETVRLEDPVFEKKFEVYSSDQVEARYLLTTSFMERLLELEQFFGSDGIQASFYNTKLLLLIPMKDNLFEPASIYEPEDFIDDARKIIKEMHLLFSVIDTLKLDMNIGL